MPTFLFNALWFKVELPAFLLFHALMDFLRVSCLLILRQFIKRNNYLLAHHVQHFAYVKLRHNVPDGPLLRRSAPAARTGAEMCDTWRLQKDGGTDRITGDASCKIPDSASLASQLLFSIECALNHTILEIIPL